MRYVFKTIVFVLFLVLIANAQNLSREQKIQKIQELNNQIKILEKDIVLPEAKDSEKAQKENLNVVRILPREKYDHKLTIRGGGAFYSFFRKTSEYGLGSDVSLEQNYLGVGFAGANYGFIADLGEISLADVSKEKLEVSFLVGYKPPADEFEIRLEGRKAHDYKVDGLTYKSRLPAVVGHTYVLRSIVFDRSDVLVAFQIHRKDADGSLIIFWKFIEQFETPRIETERVTVIIQQNSDTKRSFGFCSGTGGSNRARAKGFR
jgi:hypothetical protein